MLFLKKSLVCYWNTKIQTRKFVEVLYFLSKLSIFLILRVTRYWRRIVWKTLPPELSQFLAIKRRFVLLHYKSSSAAGRTDQWYIYIYIHTLYIPMSSVSISTISHHQLQDALTSCSWLWLILLLCISRSRTQICSEKNLKEPALAK